MVFFLCCASLFWGAILGAIFKKYYLRFINKLEINLTKSFIKKYFLSWGIEEVWAVGEFYNGKIIKIFKGKSTKKQYHKDIEKHILIISGKIIISFKKNKTHNNLLLMPGEVYHICPGTIYQIYGIVDSRYIEISSYEYNDYHYIKK